MGFYLLSLVVETPDLLKTKKALKIEVSNRRGQPRHVMSLICPVLGGDIWSGGSATHLGLLLTQTLQDFPFLSYA